METFDAYLNAKLNSDPESRKEFEALKNKPDSAKNSVIIRLEDEYDAALADEAYKEYIASGKKSYPIEVILKELDLDH